MSTLCLSLMETDSAAKIVNIPAKAVVETTLFVSPQHASLPTLVSTENVIASINNHGYELADSDEVEKITSLINTYYLPTQKSLWQDCTLELRVNRISPQNARYYSEIHVIRNAVTKAARDVAIYESHSDYVSSKKAQDNAVIQIASSVKSKPDWWSPGRILKFIGKTAIGAIVDTLVGIPLGIIVRSALDGVFHST